MCVVICVYVLRWSEVVRRLELWVQVLELNEGGEFTPVEVVPAKDVRTGGIFQLRQVPTISTHSLWISLTALLRERVC